MVKTFDLDGSILLQIKRKLHQTTWRFELEIPQEFWEDLFRVTEDDGPQTASAAHARAPAFWESLAEENANTLERDAVPGATNRRLRNVWPDYLSLEAAHRKHTH